ncbi:membrane protein [Gordonia phage KappaFarmDelta]|nr:membrane protein [Gordonia phage KappaFarmDelta]
MRCHNQRMLQTILVFVAAIAVPFITILGTWIKVMIDRRDRRATISAELDILAKLDPESEAAKKLAASLDRQVVRLAEPPEGWSVQTSAFVMTAEVLLFICVVVTLAHVDAPFPLAFSVAAALYSVLIPIGALAVRRAGQRNSWEDARPRP